MATLTMDEFAAVVTQALDALPDALWQYMDNVVVDIAEEPTRAMLLEADLTAEEIAAGETILGLFEPLQMPSIDLDFTEHPHKLWIFKNPHEREFPDPQQLRTEIRKTVVHELAHHFGYTDRDLEPFDDDPNPFDD